MAREPKPHRSSPALIGRRWVHVFEEDEAAGGHVFRLDADDIPLSRRSRAQIEFSENGSASIRTAGPDDRLVDRPLTWEKKGRDLVIRSDDEPIFGAKKLRITELSANRFVVRA